MSRPGLLLLLGLALTAGFVLAADCRAGDEESASKKAKPAKAKAQDHLDFKRSYAEALREARLRNLPVFVSRHKDF